jgi:hypothetical protein
VGALSFGWGFVGPMSQTTTRANLRRETKTLRFAASVKKWSVQPVFTSLIGWTVS